MSLDTRSLRQVLALAAYGSYRHAASHLHMSQPALSRSIAGLEATLGVRLFDRGRRGVTPTDFGRLLIERGDALIAALDDIERELTLLRGLDKGELRIGAGLYPAELSVGTAMGRISARYPGLRISLRAAPWREVAAATAAGEVDVAVVELSTLADEPRLVLEPLPPHLAVFVCRPGHPLLSESSPSAETVFRYPFAGPRLPERIRDAIGSATASLGRDPDTGDLVPSLNVESVALAKRIVAAGDAVATLPWVLVAAELREGSLVALDWRPDWLRTNYGFVYRRDRTLSPAAHVFMTAVREIEAQLAAAALVEGARPTAARPAR